MGVQVTFVAVKDVILPESMPGRHGMTWPGCRPRLLVRRAAWPEGQVNDQQRDGEANAAQQGNPEHIEATELVVKSQLPSRTRLRLSTSRRLFRLTRRAMKGSTSLSMPRGLTSTWRVN